MASQGKSKSHLGFFVALLLVVGAGGAAYLYFNSTDIEPVQQKLQTEAMNQPRPHPPKKDDATKPAPGGTPAAAPATEGQSSPK